MVTLRSCQTRVGILGLTPKGASTAACSLPSAPFGAACWAAVGEAGGVRVLGEHTKQQQALQGWLLLTGDAVCEVLVKHRRLSRS